MINFWSQLLLISANVCSIHSDINECPVTDLTVGNPCSNGTCENTNGSYNCFCPSGYVLDSSGKVCVG